MRIHNLNHQAIGVNLIGADSLHIQGINYPDSKVHGANMGPIWGRQDQGGPHVGPTNFAIWEAITVLAIVLVPNFARPSPGKMTMITTGIFFFKFTIIIWDFEYILMIWNNLSTWPMSPQEITIAPGGRLSIKMSSYQYRDSHVKDKTVSPTVLSLTWESPTVLSLTWESPTVLSLIWESSYLGKTVFILRRGLGHDDTFSWDPHENSSSWSSSTNKGVNNQPMPQQEVMPNQQREPITHVWQETG